jgi:transposase-like protein
MYITGSLKIERAAHARLTEMEGQIQAAGRAAMKAALKQAISQSEDHQQTCPACGSEQQHAQGTKRRVLVTSFARVEVSLQRRRCQRCRKPFRPADAC